MATQEIHQVLEFPSTPEIESEEEVAEWLEAFDQVVDGEGSQRGCELLDALIHRARESGVEVPVQLNTPYVNTIPVERRSSLSRRSRVGAPHQEPDALERDGHGASPEQERSRHRRPHLDLLVAGDAARSRLQSFLPRATTAISPATSSISRATPRPAFMRARIWKAG